MRILKTRVARRAALLLALAALVAVAVAAGTSFADGTKRAPSYAGAPSPNPSVLSLYSTTSVRDSGLMDSVVLPAYNALYPGVTVKPIYKGSGAAIQAARDGLADVIVVHSPLDEKALLESGDATLRLPFAYNYFTIVGPKGDPANVSTAISATQAFKRIAAWGKAKEAAGSSRVAFVARGDSSGTTAKELQLWYRAKVTSSTSEAPTGSWYITTGQGMLETLQVAAQKNAYCLTDTATWLFNRGTLRPLYRKLTNKADIRNQYSVLLINQDMHNLVESTNAELFAAWMVSNAGQKAIGDYGKDKYGQPLFYPNAYDISRPIK